MSEPLSGNEIANLLQTSRSGGSRPKADPTTLRTVENWFKLNHVIREEGCTNPNCVDPRPKTDRGTNVVVEIKDEWVCRYCFLEGYSGS